MSDAKSQQEPTMEEILASIRRIISEDGEPVPEAAEQPSPEGQGENVLELTEEMVAGNEGGEETAAKEPEVEEMAEAEPQEMTEPEPQEMTEPEPREMSEPEPKSEPSAVPGPEPDAEAETAPEGSIVAAATAAAATASFSDLAKVVSATREFPLGDGTGRTLEALVKELLRPMLKEWLDKNLPPMVKRLVEKEITKLAARADDD